MPSATSAKAVLACCAETVPERMRVPIRNRLSWPNRRRRSEKLLVGARVLHRGREPRRQFLPVRHRAEEARIDQAVHELRLPRQHLAEPRRRAQNQRHQRDEIAVLTEQRDQPPAALERLEEMIERHHRAVRLLGMREALDQGRHEFDEGASRLLVAEHAVVARDPVAHGLRDGGGRLEAERHHVLEQARIFGTGAVVERGQLGGAGRIVALEQLFVVPLDDLELAQQVACKGLAVLHSRRTRRSARSPPCRRAAHGSARRRSSGDGARPGAGIHRPWSSSSRAATVIQLLAASTSSAASVGRTRNSG